MTLIHHHFSPEAVREYMHLTLRLPLPLLRTQIEQALGEVAAGLNAGIEIQPQGEVQLHGQGDRLISHIPVRVQATADWLGLGLGKALLPGVSLPTLLRFDLAIEFETRLKVGPGWQLRAESQVSYQWIRLPSTSLGLKLPLKQLVTPLLERELKRIAQQVDTWGAAMADLPGRIAEAWTELQEPVPLDDPLVLRLLPRKEPIPVGPIQIDGKELLVSAQLPIWGRVGPSASLEGTPSVRLSPPVPFEEQGKSRLLLNICLPWPQLAADISDDEVEESIGRRVIKASWGKVKVQGEGDRFEVQARFRLRGLPLVKRRTLSGWIRMHWAWRLTPDSDQVDIEHLQVELREVPRWLKVAWGLFKPWIRRDLARGITTQIREQVVNSRQEVQELVSDYVLPAGARLRGRIRGVEILSLTSEAQGLVIQVRLKGEAQVLITEI